MAHDHSHRGEDRHSHVHAHAPADFGSAFKIGIALNVGIVVLQAVFGILGNSVALLADAVHNLSDVLGLVAAWAAMMLAKSPPTARYSYGMKGSSILASLFNAVFLLIIMGAMSWEAVRRLFSPEPVSGLTVMVVAAASIVLNGFTAWLFASGRKDDLNIRGAFLHMAADAFVSAGVVAAGLVIFITGWLWLDPVVSLAINAVIVWGTWGLLTESLAMSLNAVPSGINPGHVRAFLAKQPGVSEVHDLHIWPMSTTEIAITAHIVIPGGHPSDAVLEEISHELQHQFGIGHSTIQVETDGLKCKLAPENIV